MSQCPNCQSEIQDDFGLVTCSSCGAQVMLEMEGPSAMIQSQEASANSYAPIEFDVADVVQNQVDTEPPIADVNDLPPVPSEPDGADMTEVAEFANSEISQGREGFLRYDIFIDGIDTSEIRERVREAISDQRFLWDVEQILNNVESGSLVFKELTAVKSTVLIQKLRAVPVSIRWEQYAIHQA